MTVPFPGESIGLSYTDGVNFDSIWLRGGRGGQPPYATIAPGDEWRAWVDPGTQNYLEDASAPVVASWVVETIGGAGTLHAAWGFDPMFGDPSAPAPNDLGSQAVTGTQTVVFTTTLTAADIMDGTAPAMLLLTCTSGSVDVQQIKLRVWPPEGVAGGWVTHPGWDTEPNPVYPVAAYVPRGTVTHADEREAAWNAAAVDAASGGAGAGTGPHDVSPDGSTTESLTIAGVTRRVITPDAPPYIAMTTSLDGTNASVTFYPNGVLARIGVPVDPDSYSPVAPDLVEGVDWIIPPEEVPGEVDAYVFEWDDPRTHTWLNAAATIYLGGEAAGDVFGVGAFMVGPTLSQWNTTTDPVTGIGTSRQFNADMVDGGTLAPSELGPTITTVPLAVGDDYTILAFSHAMTTTVISWPGYPPFIGDDGGRLNGWEAHLGVGDPYSSSFAPMVDVVHLPPYRAWSPTVAPVHKLRQYHRDDGLGVAPRRAYGGASRNKTRRAYGYT